MKLIALAICLSACAAMAQTDQSAAQLAPGSYYWNGTSWISMQQISMSGGGMKHAGKMFVPGLTPQMVWTFRDARAPVQVTGSTPVFCVKLIALPPGIPNSPSGRDILVTRFDQKKDHRELQTTSGGNMFTFKAGIGKDRLPDIDVRALDDHTYIVSPKEPLPQGEYLLSTSSNGAMGYDFGLHSK